MSPETDTDLDRPVDAEALAAYVGKSKHWVWRKHRNGELPEPLHYGRPIQWWLRDVVDTMRGRPVEPL